jgi:hypothetical protein
MPYTNAMDCHSNFLILKVIGFDTVYKFTMVTGEKVEERWGGDGVSSEKDNRDL